MKFYLGNQYDVSPFAIQVDGISYYHTSTDCFPFLVLDGRVYFGKPGGEHADLEEHLGVNPTMVAEGRFYMKPGALVFWAVDRDMTPENVRLVVEALRKRIGIKPNSIRLFIDCSFDKEREYDEGLIVEMTPEEYLSHNIAGKNTEYFWALFKKKNKLSDEWGGTTQSGMNAKDVWRHYKYVDESMLKEAYYNEEDIPRFILQDIENYFGNGSTTKRGQGYAVVVYGNAGRYDIDVSANGYCTIRLENGETWTHYAPEWLKRCKLDQPNPVRLNESDIREMVRESIKRIILRSEE